MQHGLNRHLRWQAAEQLSHTSVLSGQGRLQPRGQNISNHGMQELQLAALRTKCGLRMKRRKPRQMHQQTTKVAMCLHVYGQTRSEKSSAQLVRQ